MYLIVAAMDAELKDILAQLVNKAEHAGGLFPTWTGILAGKKVLVARCGVGKVMAAMTAQALIERYRPRAILFTGLAGSLSKDLRIGDTLIARDCVQHDLDTRGLNQPRGTVPFTPYRFIPCDPALLALASTYQPARGTLHVGRICTGDQFISAENRRSMSYLGEELEGDAVEMEGAAFGLVAHIHRIPFLLARTISDNADEAATEHFEDFLPKASRNSVALLTHVLAGLPA